MGILTWLVGDDDGGEKTWRFPSSLSQAFAKHAAVEGISEAEAIAHAATLLDIYSGLKPHERLAIVEMGDKNEVLRVVRHYAPFECKSS